MIPSPGFRSILTALFMALLLLTNQAVLAAVCDVNSDGVIDLADTLLVRAARGQAASGPNDPRDADLNGSVTLSDERRCVLQCSLPNCQSNTPPVANPDTATTNQNTPVPINVVSNDTDTTGSVVSGSVAINTPPSHGNAVPNGDGTMTYNPTPVFVGTDDFTYTVRDSFGAISNAANVHVTIGAVNAPPVANAGTNINTTIGQLVTLNGSLSSDPNNDPLSFSWQFIGIPLGSTASLANANTVAPNFTPDLAGNYDLQLTVSDGLLFNSAQVRVIANPANVPPNANAGANQNALVGGLVTLHGEASNDPDNGPQPLSYDWTFLSVPVGSGLANASLLNPTQAIAQFTPDVAGLYRLNLSVSDGLANSQAQVNITAAVDVAPNANAGSDQLVQLGGTASVDGSASNDPDNGPLPLSFQWSFANKPGTSALTNANIQNATSAVANFVPDVFGVYLLRLDVSDGSLGNFAQVMVKANVAPVAIADSFQTNQNQTLNVPAPGVLVNDTDANADALTAVLDGSVGHGSLTLNPDGSFSYIPSNGFSGGDSFTYHANDGSADSGIATVSLTVSAAINQAPSFTKGADQAVNENSGAQTVPGWASAISPGPASESAQTVNFIVTGNSNPGLFAAGPMVAANGTLSYTPAANANGTATITVTLHDSGGTANGGVDTSAPQTFAITVNAVNDAPSFTAANPPTVNEDAGAQTVPAWATFSPGPTNESGQTVVSYTVSNVSNPALFSAPPTVSVGGALNYTPAANANGTSTFGVTVNDSGGTANGGVDTSTVQAFTITVNAVNDVPSFTKGLNQTVLEDAGPQTVANWATVISAGPANESAQILNFNITGNTNAGLFSAGPTVAANGTLSYTPAVNANGSATITLALHDNGGTADGGVDTSASQTFTINLTAVDDPPVAVNDAATVNEDAGANAINVLANDTDIDGGPKSVASVVQPAHGAVVITGGGTGLSYQPAANYCNSLNASPLDSFTYTLAPGSSSATVNVTVSCVNDVPVAQTKTATAQANMKITGLGGTTALTAGVTDADSGISGCSPSFTVAAVTSGTGGTVSNFNAGAGTFDFEPNAGFTGTATASYTVSDNGCPGTATSAAATINITVSGPVVWFVDDSAAAGGDGRLGREFQTIGAATSVIGANTNHKIFVYSGSYTQGATLNTDGWLIGQGVSGSFTSAFGISPPAVGSIVYPAVGGTRPTLANTVTLGTNSQVKGVNLSNGANTGITASSKTGLVTSEVSVTTTTGTAASFSSSAGSLSFTAISANGGANGIVLQNTTGSFTVNGDGTNTSVGGNASGGTISGMVGANSTTNGIGVYLNNAQNVTLRRMTISGTNQNYGIKGFSVNGFTMEYSTVSGTNGTATTLASPENYGEGAIHFGNATTTGVVGNVTFTNNNISGGAARNLSIINTVAGTTTLTVKGNTFGAMQNLSGGNQSFAVEARASSGVVINTTFGGTNAGEGNILNSAVSDLANFTGQANTTMDVVFRNNTLSNNNPGNVIGGGSLVLATKGTMTFHATGNTMRDANGSAVTLFKAAKDVPADTNPSLTGFFDSNTIGVAGVTDSGSKTGNGIFVSAGGTGTMSFTITNNQIHQIRGNGHIYADNTGGSYAANFTITGNTLDTPDLAGWFTGIAVTNGSPSSTDTVNVCAKIGGSTPAEKNTLNLASNLGVIVASSGQGGGHTFNLPTYAGGANLANVQNFIQGNNTGSFTTNAYVDFPATASAFTGTGTTCPTPLL